MRREISVITIILIIFAIGAVGYWIFSSELPDGLERTMEDAGVEEQEPVYTAPLSYGNDYFSYILMGAVGFFTILAVTFLIIKALAKKNETREHR